MKTSVQLERIFKGVANHYRIDIIKLIGKNEYIGVSEIAYYLKRNIKTISEHTYRLVKAGLINKSYLGRKVIHSLSPYGKKILKIIKEF